MKNYYIYIVTNRFRGTIYIGITSDLIKRIYQHKNKLIKGFTTKYNCTLLVYYETYNQVVDAINREKQVKKYLRAKKFALIEKVNPKWNDLYNSLF